MPQTNEIGYEEKMMKSVGNSSFSVSSSYEGLNGNEEDDQAKSERAITNNESDEIGTFNDDSTDDRDLYEDDHLSECYENFHGGYKRESEHR